ncbi:MAG: response regulator [bacterium]
MRILLVDDNVDFLNVLEELLKGHGYTPIVAQDGKQAREILEEQPVDAIISDVFMPTLDGLRFHSYVREFLGQKDIPFIFMSGYDDSYSRESLEDSSVDFFLSKGSPIGDIVAMLENIKASTQA